jgi:transaldolase
VLATESGKMVEEALKLASISEKIVIKLPMTKDGIAASSILAGKGIKTNITCVYSANQSILAANAGAAYVSPFVARGDDFGIDGIKVLQDISTIYRLHGIKTKIIAASMRSPRFVMAAAMAGSDIATIPYEVINKMFDHPLTDSSLEGFMNDWKKVMGSKGIL